MQIDYRITELRIVPAALAGSAGPETASDPMAGSAGHGPGEAPQPVRLIAFRCQRVLVAEGLETRLGEPHRGAIEVAPDRAGAPVTMAEFLEMPVAVAADGTTLGIGEVLAQAGVALVAGDG